MKKHFLVEIKKATSSIILFMLLFSFSNPFINTSASESIPSFNVIQITPNTPEIPETKASISFSINSAPNNSGSLTIWENSHIYFFDNSGVTDDQPYIGSGSGYIDLTLDEVNTPRTPLQIAEALRGLTDVYAVDHYLLDITGSGTGVTFTTSGAESSATEIEFINSTITGAITLTNSITGVLFATGIAQKVNFTVGNAPNQEHILYKTEIDLHSDVFQADTATGVALLIRNQLTDYDEVDCILTDATVTCTASQPGIPFDFTGSLVDLNNLYNTINAEYTDGSDRTLLILSDSNYTPVSWAAYSGAINRAKVLENTTSVTQEQADQAIIDISIAKSELDFYAVPGSISTATGTFLSSLSGTVSFTDLDVGGVYSLVYGGNIVSSGVLLATGTTGTLDLQPGYFTTFGNYTLSLSGSKNGSTISDLDSRWFYIGPVNYEDLFDTVGTTLNSEGIANNLSDVTNGDVDDFTGLYFEKTGYGKILFSTGMNLTDSETLSFLQSLPSKLDMSDGHISFDPSNSEFASYGATLFMYFTGSNVPDFAGDSLDYITARSTTGYLMNDALIGSNLACAVGVGIPYQVCIFANNHFTSFDFNPYITISNIVSNNSNSGSLLKYGDKSILTFTGSEALTGVTVTFNGVPALSVNGGGNTWVATSQNISSGAGEINFTIDFMDLSGNTGTTVTGTTDLSSVTIDSTSPTASIEYSTTSLTAGNVIATLTGGSETIIVTNTGGLTTHTFTENGSFTFNFRDSVGNTGSQVATVTNISNDIPVITLNGSGTINIEKPGVYTDLGAIWSDTNDGTGTVLTISGSVNTGALGTYTLQYIYVNNLGLTGSTSRTVNVVDTIAPTISEVTAIDSLTNDNTPSVVISASELSTPSFSGSCNAGTGTNTIGGGNNTITFYTLTDGAHNDCYITLTDAAGNHSTPMHVSNFTVDATGPVITYQQIKDVKDNNVNLDIGFTEPNMGGSPYGIVDFTDVGVTSTGTRNLSFSGNVASTTLTPGGAGLLSNTLYTYTITLRDSLGNTRTSTGNFTTAKVITLNTDITETGPVSLGFTGDLNEGDTYELSGSLLMYSDPSDDDSMTGSLTLSGVNIIASDGGWDGILIPPTLINPESDEAATGSEVGGGVTIIQTIKAGSETAGLSATGGYFIVSFMVPGYSSGTTFSLYRSQDGNTWTTNTPDSHCTLGTDLMCTFETDHLSFFAPGFDTVPDVFSFTAQTDRELSTQYESNTITVSGTDTGATISVVGGEYKIGSGSYNSSASTVNNGDTVTVRLISSASNSTLKTATLTIGGVSANFNVTTKASTTTGGGSSGGGGSSSTLIKDVCSNGDYSASYYDGKCGTKPTGTGSTSTEKKDDEKVGTTNGGNNQGGTNEEELDGLLGEGNGGNNNDYGNEKFVDIKGSFAKEYIERLFELGVIKGYSDGSFGPDKEITRAEFLSITMKALDIDLKSTGTNKFSDVTVDWMKKYVIKAKELGIINGQNIDGKLVFRPNDSISRIEALAIIFKAAKIDLKSDKTLEFKDTDFEDWMKPYAIKAKELGIVNGQIIEGKLLLKPKSSISRAETSKIVVKLLDLK